MMTPSYYKCALFEKDVKDLSFFEFTQDEVIFDKYIQGDKVSFKKCVVDYKVSFLPSDSIDDNKVPLLLPIKDMPDLLKFTIGKLKLHEVNKHCNIIVIDDRSSPEIKSICDEHPDISYVRVDNEKGFNYSNLINIGAYIAKMLGFTQVITWNSDMWPSNSSTVPELIKRHNNSKCTISGTKLLYPLESWNGEEVTKNINYHFPSEKETFRGTVQYGGSLLVPFGKTMTTSHMKRFGDPNSPIVNQDYATLFVTGAYSLIELEWLISSGGLNPSLSKIFNDSDMCLRAVEDNETVMYFGKDLFLNHDESVNLSNENKIDKQFNSDVTLYSKIWSLDRIMRLITK